MLGADWTGIDVAPGSSRGARLPPPLEDGFFRIADRDKDAQVAWLAALARHIAFVGPDGGTAGTWHRLFHSTPLLALSEMAAHDAGDTAQRFAARLAADWRAAAIEVRAEAVWLSGWPRRVGAEAGDRAGAILDGAAGNGAGLRARLVAISVAEDATAVARLCAPDAAAMPDRAARARALRDGLRVTHGEILTACEALRPLAREAAAALRRSGSVDPALGLLLAEIDASLPVARHIDTLIPRMVGFYYRDVLGQAPRAPDPDHILVHLAGGARPVPLPAGTGIVRQQGGVSVRYETREDLTVVPARVAEQAILRYDRDPRISFSTSLGGITGIRAERIPGDGSAAPRHVFDPDPAAGVEMGLAIQSPMLALAEGLRRVEVEVRLERPSGLPAREDVTAADGQAATDADLDIALRGDPDLLRALGFARPEAGVAALSARVRAAAAETGRPITLPLLYEVVARHVVTARGLRALLGRIVTAILIDGMDWPSGPFWEVLSDRIDAAGSALSGQRAGPDDPTPASLIAEAFRRTDDGTAFAYSVEDAFEMLLGDAFEVSLSSDAGPVAPDIARVLQSPRSHPPGFLLRLQIDPGAPAIVAPPGAEAPVLTLKLAAAARVCPQSFFEPFRLDKLRLRVRAEGLRDLVGFTDEGPVDVTQTFPAFGNRPRDGASLIVAAPEMAGKPVDRVHLAVDWAALPGGGHGFAAHYADYGRNVPLPAPEATVDYLSGDGWKPVNGNAVPLFRERPDGTGLVADQTFEGPIMGHSVPARAPVAGPVRSRGALRAGAVRLTLSGSAEGFLADRHSAALMRAMRPSRLPLRASRPIPPEPFVPRIARLTLGYSAESVIALAARDAARPGERVTQIAPFGNAEIFPHAERRDAGLFPARLGDGARFIALDGAGAAGPVSLLVEIEESGHRRVAGPRVPIAYFYLRDAGWTRLPDAAILSDGTDGLMRSGVLRIDLPNDSVRGGVGMPPVGHWIAAVAAAGDLDAFPRLRSVRTNGVWIRRADPVVEGGADTGAEAEAPPRDAGAASLALEAPVAGIGAPVAVRAGRRDRGGETLRDFRARVAETLRHRGRAVTPWDYERIALEAFPDVLLAKAFSHLDRAGPAPAPGRVTVIVVPHRPDVAAAAAPPPRFFDAAALRSMERHLQAHAPDGARIEVANPAFEVLQVRARVSVDPARDDGAVMQRLSAGLNRRLSVWTAPDEMADFGWTLDPARLRAEIRRDPAVREVTEFAVLHLVRDDTGRHVLIDTARPDPGTREGARLRPRLPWGLALSASEHILAPAAEARPVPATPAGIGGLRLGEMLVVTEGSAA